METMRVMIPVMIINLLVFVISIFERCRYITYHCQGAKLWVLVWRRPKLMRPKKMIAKPFIKTVEM